MPAVASTRPFDPLIHLDGLWTLELAQRFLPIDGMPPTRYEAADGKLVMSPRDGSATSWAAFRLGFLLDEPARAAGHAVYSALDVRTDLKGWIEPDLVILRKPVRQQTWIEPDQVLCPVEIISPSSRRRDQIDKPIICARLGIPYFLHVDIRGDEVLVELLHLADGGHTTHAKALSGQRFEVSDPFPISFDPAVLLEPDSRTLQRLSFGRGARPLAIPRHAPRYGGALL
ncbi:MAG: Uma2 family endonuclease [Micromonosporaceae bacterium]|nr:Uma2 family endonuclease [Micromonosporaceae bacterium]